MFGRPMNLLSSLVLSLIFSAVFIWAVNTLFGLGIPFTFKTYFASFAFLMCIRFFTSKTYYQTFDPLFDEFYDEDMDEDDEDDGDNNESDPPKPGRHLKRVK